MKLSKSSNQGVTIPARVSTPSTAAEMSIQLCVMSKSRRRSTTSARAPAGSASKTMGRLPAVSTSATRIGDVVRETMSQDSPTSCIHVPMLDATVAIHSARKIGSARGLHGETDSSPSFAASVIVELELGTSSSVERTNEYQSSLPAELELDTD